MIAVAVRVTVAVALASSAASGKGARDLEKVVGRAWAAPWPDGQVPLGHGFAVSPGLVLTNAHSVAACRLVTVEGELGSQPASVVGLDARIDAALLRVATAGPAFALSGAPAADQPVTVLTSRAEPVDVPKAVPGRRAFGLRNIQASNVVEITASLRPGDSGAPVVSPSGAVVGMVVGSVSGDVGRAVIVPAEALRPFLAYHGATGPGGGLPSRGNVVRVTCGR